MTFKMLPTISHINILLIAEWETTKSTVCKLLPISVIGKLYPTKRKNGEPKEFQLRDM